MTLHSRLIFFTSKQTKIRITQALLCGILTLSGFSQDQFDGFDSIPNVDPTEKKTEQLFIQEYVVPPNFLTSGYKKDTSAQDVLEGAGVTFPSGGKATFDRTTCILTVVTTKDQLELADIFLEGFGGYSPDRQIFIIAEFIEVEDALYHDWIFENRITRDGMPLRKQAQKWVKEGKATIIETALVVARSGQRAKAESGNSVTFPTEEDSPKIPEKVLLEGESLKAPITAVNPVATETRTAGTTLEIDPVLGADNFTMDINSSVEIVKLAGKIDWPPTEGDPRFTVSRPRFYKMSITTQLTQHHRRCQLMGTTRPLKPALEGRKRPIVMTFLRGDIATLGPENELRIFERRPYNP